MGWLEKWSFENDKEWFNNKRRKKKWQLLRKVIIEISKELVIRRKEKLYFKDILKIKKVYKSFFLQLTNYISKLFLSFFHLIFIKHQNYKKSKINQLFSLILLSKEIKFYRNLIVQYSWKLYILCWRKLIIVATNLSTRYLLAKNSLENNFSTIYTLIPKIYKEKKKRKRKNYINSIDNSPKHTVHVELNSVFYSHTLWI